jgi:hypothetical protein
VVNDERTLVQIQLCGIIWQRIATLSTDNASGDLHGFGFLYRLLHIVNRAIRA